MRSRSVLTVIWLVGFALFFAACSSKPSKPKSIIQIDGSSTVFPITEAMAEEFGIQNPDVNVIVGISGTGGGFKKFARGEVDIVDASREIDPSEVKAFLDSQHTKFIGLRVALDGLAVVTHPKNTFLNCLTVSELKKIWEQGSKVQKWSDVHSNWPARPIKLYGPGTESGTFDYFTKAINGKEKNSRPDYTASEDDNTLVLGVSGDKNSLGYFGYAYYTENKERLRLVAVDGGGGCILPGDSTVNDSTYKPLSRPLFIYVRLDAAAREEIKDFIRFFILNAKELVPESGYTAFPESVYSEELAKFEEFIKK